MALALENRAMADDILIGDTPKAQKRRNRLKKIRTTGRLWKHSTLADLDGLPETSDLTGFFVFTLVRNPWDRLVSYYHWLREQNFDHPAVELARQLEFPGFLSHPHTRQSISAWPARRYVTDATGTERVSAFVRLEELTTDLAPVEAHLGFRLDIPVANRSERRTDYRSYYPDRLQTVVAEICAEDIQRFGYTF